MSRRNPHGGRNWEVKSSSGDGWLSTILKGRRARIVAGSVGVCSLLAAVAVVTGLGGGALTEGVLAFLAFKPIVATLAAVAALVGALAILPEADDEEGVSLPSNGSVDESDEAVVGRDFEEKVDLFSNAAAVDGLWESYDVKGQLTELAVEVLCEDAGYEREAAKEAIENGTWTDDPRAAAYLGVDVHLPLTLEVVDWAYGERRARQTQATVRELADIAGVDVHLGIEDGVSDELTFPWTDGEAGATAGDAVAEPTPEPEVETR